MAGSPPRATACPKPSNLLGDKTSPGGDKKKSHTETTLLPPPLLTVILHVGGRVGHDQRNK